MASFDFKKQKLAWARVPVDDCGYLFSDALLALSDENLKAVIQQFEQTRYGGWRNWQNKWRSTLGLDTTFGKTVFDFGCGFGIEALQFARLGNSVILGDIVESNLRLAERVLSLSGHSPQALELVQAYPPYFKASGYDIFYCNGVLHHIPYARQIMERVRKTIHREGEVRLMLYSDQGWMRAIGTTPPEDTANDQNFSAFVRKMDSVGSYADWYNANKLEKFFGDLFDLVAFDYITPENRYCTATLRIR